MRVARFLVGLDVGIRARAADKRSFSMTAKHRPRQLGSPA
jgi:hypothetical protein